MKKFINRTDCPPGVSTTEVLKSVLSNPGSTGGLSLEELRTRIKIMDVLDQGGDYFELEDALYGNLKKQIEEFRWGMANRDLLNVIEDVLGAVDVPGDKKPGKQAH